MTSSYHLDRLIQALATPRGKGAIAVVRASGPGCIETAARVFSRPSALLESAGHRVHHGWLLDETGARVDEVLVTVFRGPASYTGDDSVEISCHGGPVVADRVQDVLRNAGFEDAQPGEFSFRAFSNGKMDLTRAEAVREIIDARTDRARALAVSRLAGSVASVVDEAKDAVRKQSAVAALALDYPEEEAEPMEFDRDLLRKVQASLRNLVSTWRTGRLYKDGLTVALAGPANAGKSSLFNLFLKEERSIVTEKPGTTRDWVEAWLNLDGIPLRLIDTAGLRNNTDDFIEVEGIRRTRTMVSSADLVVAVADGTKGREAAEDLAVEAAQLMTDETESGGTAERLIRVWNKMDEAPESPDGWLPLCVLNGTGFPELEGAIRSKALGGAGAPDGSAPVIDSVRQKTLLEQTLEALERFDEGLEENAPTDLLAEDLRDALDALGELTGAVSRTDVLETLFSDFCVGK